MFLSWVANPLSQLCCNTYIRSREFDGPTSVWRSFIPSRILTGQTASEVNGLDPVRRRQTMPRFPSQLGLKSNQNGDRTDTRAQLPQSTSRDRELRGIVAFRRTDISSAACWKREPVGHQNHLAARPKPNLKLTAATGNWRIIHPGYVHVASNRSNRRDNGSPRVGGYACR